MTYCVFFWSLSRFVETVIRIIIFIILLFIIVFLRAPFPLWLFSCIRIRLLFLFLFILFELLLFLFVLLFRVLSLFSCSSLWPYFSTSLLKKITSNISKLNIFSFFLCRIFLIVFIIIILPWKLKTHDRKTYNLSKKYRTLYEHLLVH